MSFRDLMLGALTYPDPTPDKAVRSGVGLAKRLGGDLWLAPVRVDIPALRSRLAEALVRIEQLSREEEARSLACARHIEDTGRLAAEEAGVKLEAKILTATLYEEGAALCGPALTRDACLLPLGPAVLADRALAELILFGSGRPVLVYPEDAEISPGDGFEVAAVAWDGSPRAARAVADALPALARAKTVRILVVTDEKPQAHEGVAGELVRHLAAHGIEAVVDHLPAAGRRIGAVMAEYVASQGVELLVMGGYGNARLREFVLGGATASVLEAPPCPVLMSH
jgi:nucleotide-binding universal stress UspA family protein